MTTRPATAQPLQTSEAEACRAERVRPATVQGWRGARPATAQQLRGGGAAGRRVGGAATERPATAQQGRRTGATQQSATKRPDSAPLARGSTKVAPTGWASAMKTFAPGSAEALAARKAIDRGTPETPGEEDGTATAVQSSLSPVFSPEHEQAVAGLSKSPGVRSSLMEVEALVGQDLDSLFSATTVQRHDSFDLQAALHQARRDAATRAAAERGCREAQQETRAAIQQSEVLRAELEVLRSEHQTLQQELAEQRSAAEEVVAVKRDLSHAREQLVQAEHIRQRVQQAEQATQADVDRADDAEVAVAKTAAAELEATRAEAQVASRQAAAELDVVTTELAELRAVAHSACEERASLQKQLKAAEEERSVEVARRAGAEEALRDAEKATADSEKAAAAAAASAIAKIMKTKADAADAVAVAENRASEAEARADQLSEELSDLKASQPAPASSNSDAEEVARLQRQLADLNNAFSQERASLESKIRAERALAKEIEAEAQEAASERDAAHQELQVVATQLKNQQVASAANSDECRKATLREVDALKKLHAQSVAVLEDKLREAREARDTAAEATASLRQELDDAEVKRSAANAEVARAETAAAEAMDVLRVELAAAHDATAMESERCEMLVANADEVRKEHAQQVKQLQEEIAAAVRAAEEADRQRERGVAAAAAAAADIVRTRTTRRGSAGKRDGSARRHTERVAAPPSDQWPDL